MKRKSILVLLLVTFMVSSAFAVKITAHRPVIKKEYKVKSFNSLDVRSQFDVYLTQDDNESLVIETYESILPYVDVKQQNGILEIYLDKKVNDIHWMNRDHIMDIYVSVKELEKINLSGACDLYMQSPLVTGDLKITASGASDMDLKKIEGETIKIITSGASDIDEGDLVAKKIYINASGASDGELSIVANVLDMIASGASDFDIRVDVDDIKISAHGSSDFVASGKSKTFTVNVSGSSEMKAYDLISDTVIVDASGSSNCRVHAIKVIDASSTGASTIYFEGKPDKTKIQVSGVSTIKSR